MTVRGFLKAQACAVAVAVCCAAASASASAAPRLGCSVNVWVGGQTYSGTVVRSVNTSCPFAKRVTAQSLRFIVAHGGAGDGDFYTTVYSPVTLKWYRMHCFANGDLDGPEAMRVDCRGGINARVQYVARRS